MPFENKIEKAVKKLGHEDQMKFYDGRVPESIKNYFCRNLSSKLTIGKNR